MSGRVVQGCVVLAAGASSRMGEPKGLLVRADGRTFLRAAIEALQRVDLAPLVVVLAHQREALARQVPDGVQCVVNPAPERGQKSSLALGLRALREAGAQAALVQLVDQPPVHESTLRALLAAAQQDPHLLHTASHRGQPGHPAIFPTSLCDALESAPDTEGARDVIARLGLTMSPVEVDDPGVLLDLDTPEDLARWRADGEGA
ncbi:MAG: nucleotidyltransferase family protein [Deltaproteobacteria bacterium]|nr:nucleotidyltransferase family protein [Deltaproteobacteria bacterium]